VRGGGRVWKVVTVNNDQLDLVVAFCGHFDTPEIFHLPNEPSRVNNPGEIIFLEATCLGFDNAWLREASKEEASSRQGER
jgi:hypothetical protein